jgi:hypothetical protein
MKNVLTLVAIIGVLLSPHAIAQTAPITPTTKIEHKANVAVVVTEKPATPSSIEKPIEVNPSERMYHPKIQEKREEIRDKIRDERGEIRDKIEDKIGPIFIPDYPPSSKAEQLKEATPKLNQSK